MVTDRIVEHCLSVDGDRPDLPAHLLDWFAVAIGGATHADSTPAVLDGVRRIAGPTPDPNADATATLLPSGERLTPADAALANGALAHSLDFDDTHLASSLHPGAPVIAAALAAPTAGSTALAVGAAVATYIEEVYSSIPTATIETSRIRATMMIPI